MATNSTTTKPRPALIVGLGNPGKKYTYTRHNVGFLTVEALAKQHHASWHDKPAWCAEVAELAPQVFAIKPTTYMNESGRAVRALADYYDIPQSHICLVYDDRDLPFGKLRWTAGFRTGASHNGVRSVAHLVGKSFSRLRFGVGNATMHHMPLDKFVLQEFNAFEKSILDEQIALTTAELTNHFKL